MKNKNLTYILTALCIAFMGLGEVMAQTCASPTSLTSGVNLASETTCGLGNNITDGCSWDQDFDAIYTYTVGAGGAEDITVDMTNITDAGFGNTYASVSVFSGTCGSVAGGANCLGFSRNFGSSADLQVLTTSVPANTVIYVHIDSYINSGGDCLDFDVMLTAVGAAPPPAGATCALAIDLDTESSPYSGSTATAGLSKPYTTCGSSTANQMVHVVTVPDTYTLDIQVTSDTYDTRHSLYLGCPDTGTQIVCADEPDNELVSYTNTSGSTETLYWIQGAYSSATGTYDLEWTVSAPPTCLDPTGLATSSVTASGFNVDWSTTNATSDYEVFVVLDGATPGATADASGTAVMGANSVAVTTYDGGTALLANTDYDVYLQEDCSAGAGGVSTLIGPFSVSTPCAVYTPDYDEDFASFIPACWDEAGAGSPATGASDVGSGLWGSSTALGTGSAKINLYTTNREDWLLSPNFDLSTGGYEVVIDVALTGFGNGIADPDGFGSDDEVQLVYTEDGGATWNNITTWNAANSPSEVILTESFALSSTGTSVQFGVWATDGSTNDIGDYDFHVSNFMVRTPPTCQEPTALGATNITASGADLSWMDNASATTFDIEIGAAGFTPSGTPTYNDVAASPYMYSAATPETAYEFYVRADCGSDNVDVSAWTGPYSFTTPCATYTPDYSEDFTSFVPNCWDEAGAGTPATGASDVGSGLWGSSTALGTGSAKINLYTNNREDWLLSPSFDLSSGGYEVVIDVALTGYNNAIADPDGFAADDEVQFLYTEDGGATWTNLTTWNAANSPDETGLTETFAMASTGSAVQFAVWATDGAIDDSPNDYDFHVSNFMVRTPPSCPDVSALMASNLSLTNVDVSWTAATGATNYLWEIQDQGVAQGTASPIASGSGAMTSASAAGTYVDGNDYTLYVASDCGGAVGTYQSIDFTLNIPPANDLCSGAIPLTLGSLSCGTPTAGTNVNATSSGLTPGCGSYSGGDIWYSVVVPASGDVVVQSYDTGSSWSDGGMAIYSGTCPSGLTLVECDDDGGTSSFEMIELSGRTPGETLYIAVWEYGNNAFGGMEICAWEPPAPVVNDDCADAIEIIPSVHGENGFVSYSTANSSQSLSGCAGTADDDVWFYFVAESENDAVFVRGATGYDAVVEVFDACGGASLGCEDETGSGAIERLLPGNLTVGNTYYFRVYHYFSSLPTTESVEVQVKTFENGGLQDAYCGGTDNAFSDVVYAERDDLGQLYSNPNIPVTGYRFKFEEVGGGLNAEVNHMTYAPYISLGDVPGLEYGKSYNVSVSHQLLIFANGNVDQYWSAYGDPCTVGMQSNPTSTMLADGYCGQTEMHLIDQLQAEPVPGATVYEFTFTGNGQTMVEYSNNYTVYLYNVGDAANSIQYNAAYSVVVRANVEGIWSLAGAPCSIGMDQAPEDCELQAVSCGGTFDFPASNALYATQIYGATEYTWEFTPVAVGPVQETTSTGLSLALHLTDLSLDPGQYTVRVKAKAGGVYNDYPEAAGCVITISGAAMEVGIANGSVDGFAVKSAVEQSTLATTIFPNPNNGEQVSLDIVGLDAVQDRVEVSIFDLSGKLVFTQAYPVKGESARLLINPATALSAGSYIVQVQSGATSTQMQLMVK